MSMKLRMVELGMRATSFSISVVNTKMTWCAVLMNIRVSHLWSHLCICNSDRKHTHTHTFRPNICICTIMIYSVLSLITIYFVLYCFVFTPFTSFSPHTHTHTHKSINFILLTKLLCSPALLLLCLFIIVSCWVIFCRCSYIFLCISRLAFLGSFAFR